MSSIDLPLHYKIFVRHKRINFPTVKLILTAYIADNIKSLIRRSVKNVSVW